MNIVDVIEGDIVPPPTPPIERPLLQRSLRHQPINLHLLRNRRRGKQCRRKNREDLHPETFDRSESCVELGGNRGERVSDPTAANHWVSRRAAAATATARGGAGGKAGGF